LQASAAPDHKTLQSQIRQTAGKRLLLNTLEIVHDRPVIAGRDRG
jgi:hypothetical protein